MNETIKTTLYILVAVVVSAAAVVTYPRQEAFELPDLVGKALFEDFTDPEAAAELYILTFREDLGEFSEFEVARDLETGLWVIPSSGNYPADADAQMRDAATSLIDLKVIGEASSLASEHETYGVIEPKRQMDRTQSGVGRLVTFKDSGGSELAELIIGKRVKGSDDLHFVRKPDTDSVYVVKIDPEKFPTEFEKWIERDLLRLNTLDIDRFTFQDYSIVEQNTTAGPRAQRFQRFVADVAWEDDANQWNLQQLLLASDNQLKPTTLLETEELDPDQLDRLKAALDDMKIVGVVRKPTALGADLRAGTEFTDSQENLISLASRGFYLTSFNGAPRDLYAANGELAVSLSDGVQYLLRFGKTAQIAKESEEGKLSRFLFVMAQLDESKFPPLELEPLPELPEGADDQADIGDKSDLALQRERIRKENQRKKDEREEKLRQANQRINELNSRFADWYYVISEDEFKRVKLSHNDLIRESAAAREFGFGIDAFRQLQQEGIDPPEDQAP
jgi:hypothetical protein